MILQRFLRGFAHLNVHDIRTILDQDGICSAWSRANVGAAPHLADAHLASHPFEDHVLAFDQPCTTCGTDLRDHSPYISLAVGTAQEDHALGLKQWYPAWYTAVDFATDHFSDDPGWIVSGYTYVLGRSSRELVEFAEEARDLHQFGPYNRHHHEGEVVAKLRIPPVRLERAIEVHWPDVKFRIDNGNIDPWSVGADVNAILDELTCSPPEPGTFYRAPELYSNVRDLL